MTRRDVAMIRTRRAFAHPVSLCVLALAVASALPGCFTSRSMFAGRQRDPMAGAPRMRNVSNPPLEEVVAHLNRNTDRIQSWRANSVKIRANGMSVSGTLAVEKGRHLRLVVNSLRGNEVDLGSNDERFWVWSREMQPAFVTCKHENMDAVRQEMGIPFEPDWLMQALGVARLPATGVTMEADPTNQQARLVEQIVSAHGQPLRRAVLVDLRRGIVIEHSLYNYNGERIAQARLSDHKLNKAAGAVLPHRVELEWPQNQLSLTMCLGGVQINPESIPARVWEVPAMQGYQIVHLDAGVDHRDVASSTHLEPPIRTSSIQRIRSHDDATFLHREAEAGPPGDDTGRARLTPDDDEFVPPLDDAAEWDK
jgi:hypothetical protein